MKDESNAVKIELDLTKPVTTLIQKISDATGVLYEPTRIKRKAKADAESKIILAKATAKAASVEERALRRLVQLESKRQVNIEAVVAGSLPQIDSNAKPESLEDDWVVNFIEKSKDVSDEEVRDIWSRLLAGETNCPGSFSKRTVNLLAELDKNDALLFTNLAQFTVREWTGHTFPYIKDLDNSIYSSAGINFEQLQHLDSLGLIKFNNIMDFSIQERGNKGGLFYVEYQGHGAWTKVPEGHDTQLSIGKAMYTQQGLELLKICSPKDNTKFWDYIRTSILDSGLTIVDEEK